MNRFRSTPITSLTFLNNLRSVHGKSDAKNSFTFHVVDNPNLQSLIDHRLRDGAKLELKEGSILIYNNIMLCEQELVNFKSLIEPLGTKGREYDIINNNGNLRTCKNRNIKTYFHVKSHDECEISWEELSKSKDTSAYILQYAVIDAKQIKQFDDNMLYERDICSSFSWKNLVLLKDKLTETEKDGRKRKSYVLKDLMQYTTYVFTIQPIKHSTDEIEEIDYNYSQSGSSELKRFTTLMNVPMRVIKVSTLVKSSTSITLEWDVVPNERAAIKQFLIHVFEKPANENLLDDRNYCQSPITREEREDSVIAAFMEHDNYESVMTNKKDCCEMCCEKEKKMKEDAEKEDDSFADIMVEHAQEHKRPNREKHREKMMDRDDFRKKYHLSGEQLSFSVRVLSPYTYYSFHIYACTEDRKCSDYVRHTDRTAAHEKYDQVEIVFATNQFLKDTFRVYFEEPKIKNSAIINYIVQIKRKDGRDSNLIINECITRKKHENNKYL
jgi:hypothetical protein